MRTSIAELIFEQCFLLAVVCHWGAGRSGGRLLKSLDLPSNRFSGIQREGHGPFLLVKMLYYHILDQSVEKFLGSRLLLQGRKGSRL